MHSIYRERVLLIKKKRISLNASSFVFNWNCKHTPAGFLVKYRKFPIESTVWYITWKLKRRQLNCLFEHLRNASFLIVINWYKYGQINVNYGTWEDLDFLRTIDSGDRCVPAKALIHQTALDSDSASSNFLTAITNCFKPHPYCQIHISIKPFNLSLKVLVYAGVLNIKQIRARTEAWQTLFPAFKPQQRR